MRKLFKVNLDILGFCVSFLCAIHCFLLPFLLIMVSSLSVYSSKHDIFEYIFFSLSIIIASISLIHSYFKKHKNSLPLKIAVLGFLSIMLGLFIHGMLIGIILSVTGGLLIAFAHFKNLKICRKTSCSD